MPNTYRNIFSSITCILLAGICCSCHAPTLIDLPDKTTYPCSQKDISLYPASDQRDGANEASFAVDDYAVLLKDVFDSSQLFRNVVISRKPAPNQLTLRTSILDCQSKSSPSFATYETSVISAGLGGVLYIATKDLVWPILLGGVALSALWVNLRGGAEYNHEYTTRIHFSLLSSENKLLWDDTLSIEYNDVYTEAFGSTTMRAADLIMRYTSWTPQDISQVQLLRSLYAIALRAAEHVASLTSKF